MLTDLLKRETSELHAAIEATSLAQKVGSGTISRADYIHLLRRLLHVHEMFERRMTASPHLACVWKDHMVRSRDLISDLNALHESPLPLPFTAAETWTTKINHLIWAPLGASYVFEGSRLGSFYLIHPLARALQAPVRLGCGLDYHLRESERRHVLWNQFRDTANSLTLSENDKEEVICGARDTFAMLLQIYAAYSE